MLIIRLLRFGKKHKPSFRLILIEKGRRPGKYLENLGFYNSGEKKHKIEAEKIKNWIGKGAQLTATVHNILVEAKIIEGPKVKINISKSKKSLPAEKQVGQAGFPAGAAPVVKPVAEAAKSAVKPAESGAQKSENSMVAQ
ncbi:30S ribosomal protein S16 [Patescibacteria group bacterium]|nr:30S ribosomal protein S16 [Patescibacteria group bacterium]